MSDYTVHRCYHDGFTIVKLPPDVDPRGKVELKALDRAHADQAWRRRNDRPATIPRNMLRFGKAAKA